jgi:hypothetical protein
MNILSMILTLFNKEPKAVMGYNDIECSHPPEGSCDHGWRGHNCKKCKYYKVGTIREDGPTPARPLHEVDWPKLP